MISNITDQLIRDEEVRLHIYQDSVGKWTIGVGRNLSDVGISLAEAKLLLNNDIEHARRQLEMNFPWVAGLSEARYGVLLNMAFNMGCGKEGLGGFTHFLASVEQGNFADAARQMLESKWAKQVGNRAQRLSIQMSGDAWQ